MGKKSQLVVPHCENWAIKGEGNKKATKVTKNKKEAEKIARKIAKENKSELFIHDKKGRIINRNSFGNDPHPPIDKKH